MSQPILWCRRPANGRHVGLRTRADELAPFGPSVDAKARVQVRRDGTQRVRRSPRGIRSAPSSPPFSAALPKEIVKVAGPGAL